MSKTKWYAKPIRRCELKLRAEVASRRRGKQRRGSVAIFLALALVLSLSLVIAVPVGASPDGTPTIDGVIDTGEWDGAVEIDVAEEMGTVKLLASTDYLYVLFDVLDATDAREGENQIGNDKIGLNINPTHGGPWGKPYDIVFQTGADPDAFTTPDPDIEGSSGNTDYWKTEWVINGEQLDLPEDLETMTLYSGGTRISEWKVPLATIAPSPGDTLRIGGACDNLHVLDGPQGNSYSYPPNLLWDDASTYAEYSLIVENETTGLYYPTIQGAIDAASPGDTINVAAGTYDEAVSIGKQLTLLGAQHGVDPTAAGARTDGTAESIINTHVGSQHSQGSVDIKADGVTVDGFTVTEARAHAILVHNDKSGNTIINNILSNNTQWGVQIGTGLNHDAASNTVTNNVISHNGYDGIHLWDADYNTITGNVISYSGRCGIYLSWSDDNTVEDNTISYSGQVGSQEWISGISLDHGFRNTLTGNTLSNNQERGICMWDSEENTLTHNTICDNEYGIYLRLKPDGNVDNEAHYNNIVDNTYGVYNTETETFDATNNWWGTLSESAIQGMLSGNVDYDPWDNEAHTQSYTTPSEVWVDDDWAALNLDDPVDGHFFGYDVFATIQGGVDAVAEPGTVNVASGEYDAFAVEDRSDLSIIGEEGATVVDAIELDGNVVMALIIESTDIDISDIDFDGTESSPDTGIFYLDSTGSIADLTVSNITGEEYSFGIVLVASDVDILGVNVDSSMAGIFILGAEANLDECTITGMSSEGGIGIMAIDGAVVSIENSEISGFWVVDPEPGTAGLGMMIGDPEELEEDLSIVDMTGCTISGNNFGIYIDDDGDLVAHFNNIVENDVFGVLNEAAVSVDATENWWGTTTESEIEGMVEGEVDYTPWLPASFDQVVEGAVDSAPVSGSETGEVDLKDDDKNTIATVDISDAPSDAEGTIIASRYSEEPAPGGISLSAGTGKTGVVFLDIQVTGYASGTAHITVPYPDVDPDDGFVDNTDPLIDETTLGFYYWDQDASMWLLADNNEVDTDANTVSGDIPVGALIGTPNGLSGYPADEATVEIRNITDLSFSGNDTVDLTITTTTAQLGAATIEVTFDNTVVEVLGGENSQFDSLTVNPFYGPQTARFVANQLGAAGVDATGDGAVLAQVRLKAVGTTGSSSPLTLSVITLKDNDGISIPYVLSPPGTATIGGLGDANSDGAVDVYDCVFIARAIAGISGYIENSSTMDVDGKDGVDAFDCTYLARHIAGIAGYELGG